MPANRIVQDGRQHDLGDVEADAEAINQMGKLVDEAAAPELEEFAAFAAAEALGMDHVEHVLFRDGDVAACRRTDELTGQSNESKPVRRAFPAQAGVQI